MKKKTLIISIVSIIILASVIVSCIILLKPFNKKNNDNKDNNNSSATNVTTNKDKFEYQSEEQAKSMFNAFFDIYKDSYANSIRVKQLLAIIKSQNEQNENHKVEAIINGESTLSSSKINNTHTYNINFEYDSNGYITKAIIKEN